MKRKDRTTDLVSSFVLHRMDTIDRGYDPDTHEHLGLDRGSISIHTHR